MRFVPTARSTSGLAHRLENFRTVVTKPGNTSSHLRSSNGLLLDDVVDSRDNNLNLIRLIAAVVVFFSHCFHVTGNGHLEPLEYFSSLSMGYIAVGVFFFASGMLITKSWLATDNLIAFSIARVSRIYPALWLSLVLCIFVVGLSFTNLESGEFLTHGQVWKYAIINGTLISARFELPGVFRENLTSNVNGPLWTLPFEIQCYCLVAVLGLLNLLRSRKTIVVLFLTFFSTSVAIRLGLIEAPQPRLQSTIILTTLFLAGSVVYRFRDRIVLQMRLTLVFLALPILAAFIGGGLFRISLDLAIPYLTLFFAYVPSGGIRNFNRLGDYSYGIYIFGWPIQQVLVAFWPDIHWFVLFLIAMPLVLGLAIFSWNFVESAALKFSRKVRRAYLLRLGTTILKA